MERICLQTVNSNCWRRSKIPGSSRLHRLTQVYQRKVFLFQFASHYLLWCPLHGWLTTQWSSLRQSERLTEKLRCQGRKATPAHRSWTCEVSSFHSAFQFFSTAPGLHTVGDILEMTEALTEGKWPVRGFPTPTGEAATPHSVSGSPPSGITRLFPTSNLRCFSINTLDDQYCTVQFVHLDFFSFNLHSKYVSR